MIMSGSKLVVVVVTLFVGYGRCFGWNKDMSHDQYMRRLGVDFVLYIRGYKVLDRRGAYFINLGDGNRLGVNMDAATERLRLEGKQHLDNAVACLVERRTDCFHIFERIDDYILVDGMFRIGKEVNAKGFNGKFASGDIWLGKYDDWRILQYVGKEWSILNWNNSVFSVTNEYRKFTAATLAEEPLSRRGLRKSSKLPTTSIMQKYAEFEPRPETLPRHQKSRKLSTTRSPTKPGVGPIIVYENDDLAEIIPTRAAATEVNNEYLSYDSITQSHYIHGYKVENDFIVFHKAAIPVDAGNVHQKYDAMIRQRLTKIIKCVLAANCVHFHTFLIKENGEKEEMVVDGMYNIYLEINSSGMPKYAVSVPKYTTFNGDLILCKTIDGYMVKKFFAEVKSIGETLKKDGLFATVNVDKNIFENRIL